MQPMKSQVVVSPRQFPMRQESSLWVGHRLPYEISTTLLDRFATFVSMFWKSEKASPAGSCNALLYGFEAMFITAPKKYFLIFAHNLNCVVHIRSMKSSALSFRKKPFHWSAYLPKMACIIMTAQRGVSNNNIRAVVGTYAIFIYTPTKKTAITVKANKASLAAYNWAEVALVLLGLLIQPQL